MTEKQFPISAFVNPIVLNTICVQLWPRSGWHELSWSSTYQVHVVGHCVLLRPLPKKYGYPDQLSLIRGGHSQQLGTLRLVSSSNAGIATLPLDGEDGDLDLFAIKTKMFLTWALPCGRWSILSGGSISAASPTALLLELLTGHAELSSMVEAPHNLSFRVDALLVSSRSLRLTEVGKLLDKSYHATKTFKTVCVPRLLSRPSSSSSLAHATHI